MGRGVWRSAGDAIVPCRRFTKRNGCSGSLMRSECELPIAFVPFC